MFRLLKRLLFAVLTLGVVAGGVYMNTKSFAQRWRQFVVGAFEERGVHMDFDRLGLSLLDGVVAREVRIFGDAGRQQLLMTMDRLNLDLDYGRLLQGKFGVEGLDLSDTSVTLPLDPQKAVPEHLDLRSFSARVLLMDDRLEIRRAEGDLAGVHVVITGTLRLPERMSKDKHGDRKLPPKGSFTLTHEHRSMIQRGLVWLERFTFAQRPEIALDIDGSLDQPDDLHASLRVSARGVGHDTYVCEELSATAEYHDHILDIRRLMMRDHLGVFEASAIWPLEADNVQFTVNTTADLPQLAQSFFQNNELREVVFYESSPPSLTMEGKWFIAGPKAGPHRPVEALGRLKFGRFTSRGEVFDGLTASFGVSPEGYYIRDALLRHKSGTLSLQAMSQDIEGVKYRTVLRMDPHAFLPFADTEGAREIIRRFEFNEHSTIFVQLEGTGSSTSLADCHNIGRVELRDFRYRGMDFISATGDAEVFNSKLIFRNIAVAPREGNAAAEEVLVDNEAKTVLLKGVKAKVDPVPLTSCFAKETAQIIAKYHFGPHTEIALNGVIGYAPTSKSDLNIKFNVDDGSATYPLWERDYKITEPSGTIGIANRILTYDIKGRLFGSALAAKGHVALGATDPRFDIKLSAGEVRHIVLGKDLPFHNLNVVVEAGEKSAPFDISAQVLGGNMTLKGAFDHSGKSTGYHGELRVNAVSFPQFSRVYAPGNESEGDITGHFEFTGKPGQWKELSGGGVLIILNGNLYALPVLGPLTPLLGALLPAPIKGYNVAHEANCNFQVADGFIVTKDFEALTAAFKLVANGSIDFINDNIDFTVQARVRGLPGIVLRPVSELLEFRGDGPVAKPEWHSRLLTLGRDRTPDDRKPPTQAELNAAQKAAASKNEPNAAPAKPESNSLRERLRIAPLFKR